MNASGPTPRTVQIHPLDRCNLACAHCYSESSPAGVRRVEPARLLSLLEDCAAMGYDHLSLSGGEPLLYPALADLTRLARRLGLRVSVATNGTVATAARIGALLESVDVFAVSLDGPPSVHDRFRGSGAFDRALSGARRLVAGGANVAVSHVLTRSSLPHLAWLVGLCLEHGFRLLHVHPLESSGAGTGLAQGEALNPVEAETAYYTMHATAALVRPALAIQLDLVRRQDLAASPERVYAGEPGGLRPADQLGVLVVEPDGAIVPLNVGDHRLLTAFGTWLQTGYPRLRQLCRRVWEELVADGPEFVNWYEQVALASTTWREPAPQRAAVGPQELLRSAVSQFTSHGH